MYAVVETGGKQYRLEEGQIVRVERLRAEPGEMITLDRVILIGDGATTRVGAPVVTGAAVKATVVAHGRDRKVIVFKYKPKAHHRRKTGHRQQYTTLRIEKIEIS